MADLGLHLAGLAACPGSAAAGLEAGEALRRVLDLLRTPARCCRDVPDTSVVAWPSTGWTNNRNVTQMLELWPPVAIAISGRVRRRASGIWPAVPSRHDDGPGRGRRQDGGAALAGHRPRDVGEAGEPGVGRRARGGSTGARQCRRAYRAVSPFDRLIHDRKRAWSCGTSTAWSVSRRQPALGLLRTPVLHHDQLIVESTPAGGRVRCCGWTPSPDVPSPRHDCGGRRRAGGVGVVARLARSAWVNSPHDPRFPGLHDLDPPAPTSLLKIRFTIRLPGSRPSVKRSVRSSGRACPLSWESCAPASAIQRTQVDQQGVPVLRYSTSSASGPAGRATPRRSPGSAPTDASARCGRDLTVCRRYTATQPAS
jgi:hypothetical protein